MVPGLWEAQRRAYEVDYQTRRGLWNPKSVKSALRKRFTSRKRDTKWSLAEVPGRTRRSSALSVVSSISGRSLKPMKVAKPSGTTKVVLLQGTFDLLNWGHVKAFQRAKAQGDYLIVALNTNALIKKFKGRDAVLPWYQKKFIIESCVFVDKVVRAPDFSPLKLLKRYKVDVFVLTREWHDSKAREIAYMKRKGGKVVYSPRFKNVIPTSEIKRRLLKEAQNGGKR